MSASIASKDIEGNLSCIFFSFLETETENWKIKQIRQVAGDLVPILHDNCVILKRK